MELLSQVKRCEGADYKGEDKTSKGQKGGNCTSVFRGRFLFVTSDYNPAPARAGALHTEQRKLTQLRGGV